MPRATFLNKLVFIKWNVARFIDTFYGIKRKRRMKTFNQLIEQLQVNESLVKVDNQNHENF